MGHKMKYPKGKGFPFKDGESPFKGDVYSRWNQPVAHSHNEDGTIDWGNANDQIVYGLHEAEDGEIIGTSTDYTGTPEDEMDNVDDNMTGRIETGIDWGEAVEGHGEGNQLIEPSLDPDAESILSQQAREREESGAHRYGRGNQPQNPGTPEYPYDPLEFEQNTYDVEYPWPDEPFNPDDYPDGWGAGFDNLIEVPDEPVGEAEVDENPIRDPIISTDNDPDGDGEANVDPDRGPSTRPRPNVSYLSDRPDNVSPANTRPNSRPNVSPANTRPNVSLANTRPTTTDIFGNEVSAVDGRGRQVPHTTVTTPGKFSLGRKNVSTKGKRGFRKDKLA